MVYWSQFSGRTVSHDQLWRTQDNLRFLVNGQQRFIHESVTDHCPEEELVVRKGVGAA